MCGVAGILNRDRARSVDHDFLLKMALVQAHRGPDQSGEYIDDGIGLAHRRLSIIDLSSGKQPLTNEDGNVIVTYNGEIYNYRELMDELKAKGHQFRTRSDTEVIVHAWEEWGRDCVKRFRGMFAFAIWDRRQEVLFVARDRLGIKPIYFTILENNQFLFASELKALEQHPLLPRGLDYEAVQDYFSLGYIPEPKTIYAGVRKLLPGHYIYLDRASFKVRQEQYWDLPFGTSEYGSEKDITEELLHRLREAVKIRLVSEVPIGAFLSGGVDSSTIVALMAELNESQITTCNISFDNEAFDESVYASGIAQRYGTNHIVERVGLEHFNVLDRIIHMYDEPFADSSSIPTYMVCEMARKHMTVVLSGDGGDETFAGYRRHKMHMHEEKVRSLLPLGIRKTIFGFLGAAYPKADWAPQFLRAKTTFQSLSRDSVGAYFNSVSILNDDTRNRLFSREFKKNRQGYSTTELFYEYARNCPSDHPLSQVQYIDYKTYLPGDILTKVDRASMANSLEVRVPILDHKFLEWASALDPGVKLKNGEGKYILKKAMEPYLPDDVLYRKKMGFSVPIGHWLRNELKDELSVLGNNSMLADMDILDMKFVNRMVSQHISGSRDHTPALWSLLVFDRFVKEKIQ